MIVLRLCHEELKQNNIEPQSSLEAVLQTVEVLGDSPEQTLERLSYLYARTGRQGWALLEELYPKSTATNAIKRVEGMINTVTFGDFLLRVYQNRLWYHAI